MCSIERENLTFGRVAISSALTLQIISSLYIEGTRMLSDTTPDIPFVQTDAQISASSRLILRNVTIIFISIVVIIAYFSSTACRDFYQQERTSYRHQLRRIRKGGKKKI